jgi:uncharacterized protein YcfJ
MNRSMIVGTVAGITLATAGAVIAGYALRDDGAPEAVTQTSSAQLSQSEPTARAPEEECWDEVVEHQADPKDENRIAGTAIGAVVGGVIGSTIGGGDGKKLATVAGAAGGAVAGNQVQKKVQEKNTYTTTERRCKPAGSSQ